MLDATPTSASGIFLQWSPFVELGADVRYIGGCRVRTTTPNTREDPHRVAGLFELDHTVTTTPVH